MTDHRPVLHLDVRPGWVVDCAVPPYEAALGITIRAARTAGD